MTMMSQPIAPHPTSEFICPCSGQFLCVYAHCQLPPPPRWHLFGAYLRTFFSQQELTQPTGGIDVCVPWIPPLSRASFQQWGHLCADIYSSIPTPQWNNWDTFSKIPQRVPSETASVSHSSNLLINVPFICISPFPVHALYPNSHLCYLGSFPK